MPHLCKRAALLCGCWPLCLLQVAVTQQSSPPHPDSTPQSAPCTKGTFCEQSAEGMKELGTWGSEEHNAGGGTGMSSASRKGLKLGHFGEGLQTLPPCFRCDQVCSSKRAPWLTRCPYLSRVTGFSLRHGDTYLPTSELLLTK